MTKKNMTIDQEHIYYANPDNQISQGPPVRRRAKLSDPVPVRGRVLAFGLFEERSPTDHN